MLVLVIALAEEYHRARARWESGRIIADSTGWGSSFHDDMTFRIANGFHLPSAKMPFITLETYSLRQIPFQFVVVLEQSGVKSSIKVSPAKLSIHI